MPEGSAGCFDDAGPDLLFAGAPIIVTRNDYDRSLFNGDVGIIMKNGDSRYGGLFSRYDGFASFPVEALPPFELSFAITVHKSQGSEYGAVLLVLPEGMTDPAAYQGDTLHRAHPGKAPLSSYMPAATCCAARYETGLNANRGSGSEQEES